MPTASHAAALGVRQSVGKCNYDGEGEPGVLSAIACSRQLDMLIAAMKRVFLVVLLMALTAAPRTQSSDQPTGSPRELSKQSPLPTVPNVTDANPDLLQLAVQDQWDRGNDMFGGRSLTPDLRGKSIEVRDEERQDAVRKLLADGSVKSGFDFWLSALIFQHSQKPEGVLLAHVLASTAAAKGNGSGKYLAAASLDRYLWYINQPQVFGTQFKKDPEGKWTMEPYTRATLSDSERAIWCVAPLTQQETILKNYQDDKPPASTGIKDCK
jgi:hypothetical protein